MTLRTIRRTIQEHDHAISQARPDTMLCYSVENGFVGTPVRSFEDCHPRDVLRRFRRAKLQTDGKVFILSVHSNLWYTWPVIPGAAPIKTRKRPKPERKNS